VAVHAQRSSGKHKTKLLSIILIWFILLLLLLHNLLVGQNGNCRWQSTAVSLIWCRICFHLGHVLFFSKNPTSLFWVGRMRGDRFFDRHPNRMRNYQMRGNLLRPSEKITREKQNKTKKKKKVDENLRNKNLSVKVYRVRPTVANWLITQRYIYERGDQDQTFILFVFPFF
jgi:hypothetical protein